MRVYVEWVMNYYYSAILSHWALVQEVQELRDQTRFVCYEDLMLEDRDLQSVHYIVDHLFDGSPPKPWKHCTWPRIRMLYVCIH